LTRHCIWRIRPDAPNAIFYQQTIRSLSPWLTKKKTVPPPSETGQSGKRATLRPEKKKGKYTYWEIWGVQRKAGPLYSISTVSVYALSYTCLFKVYYAFYAKSFSNFHVDWWGVVGAIAAGALKLVRS
jgi:hypothetical protein